jgi:uncharacterized MAPEG superfamily protein
MSRELFWLTLTIVVTGLLWVPYILDRFAKWGALATLDNPKRNNPSHSPWAIRMMKAHENAIENLVIFGLLVLIVHELELSSRVTAWACIVYFWARLVHVVAYTLGIPYVRTLGFTFGFLAQAALAIVILSQVHLFPAAVSLPLPEGP